ncbi:MAG: aspartate-semialdehyde dehydrogenase [Bacteroidales bacterium]|jgi:aspartate-semialdehyde dehydrogenase|nr:aspartate-semialdehyde dehydrogenase [Bacteroidales bacterium]
MKIAVVGATGLVGGVILKVLEERGFSSCDIIGVATKKNVGKRIPFSGREIEIIDINDAINSNCDYAIFSAGGKTSKDYAPLFAQKNTTVIDNSSAWRMEKDIPLVVPQINSYSIKESDRIIANPNCSTIQMVMGLYPLHKRYRIKRIVVSTYQSITGTGVKAVRQLASEEKGDNVERIYPHPIHHNLFPCGGEFLENGYTTEEEKLINETRKIFEDDSIKISPTVVRVPVLGGHSESVNVSFYNPFNIEDVFEALNNMEGVKVLDDIKNNVYPMPIYSQDKDDVFVGRIRRDYSQENTLNMWIVADNLRKGAATNAVEIMQYLIKSRG